MQDHPPIDADSASLPGDLEPAGASPTMRCPSDTCDDGASPDSWRQFWASSFPPSADDEAHDAADRRPTLRPTGEVDALPPAEASSGVHRIVPLSDYSEVESIEAAVRKLLAG